MQCQSFPALPLIILSAFLEMTAAKRLAVQAPVPVSLLVAAFLLLPVQAHLNPFYYDQKCPQLQEIVRTGVEKAFRQEARIAASLLRLHFHDCFVGGCDASVLLDDTSTLQGEKGAGPNLNSLRGFAVMDTIKAELEKSCPGVVSCADILAVAARDSVALTGGPSWEVLLGRKDSLTANRTAANVFLPSPTSNVSTLVAAFARVGLDQLDMITLSGAHSIGNARCSTIQRRLFNNSGTGKPDPTINGLFLASLQSQCQPQANTNTVVPLDFVSPMVFDNHYYLNLQAGKGIFRSDQALFNEHGIPESYVRYYSFDQGAFFQSFARSMVKMGNLFPLTGTQGEVRKNCRFRN